MPFVSQQVDSGRLASSTPFCTPFVSQQVDSGRLASSTPFCTPFVSFVSFVSQQAVCLPARRLSPSTLFVSQQHAVCLVCLPARRLSSACRLSPSTPFVPF